MSTAKGKKIGKMVGIGLMVAAGIAILLHEKPEEQLPPPPNERPARLLTVETAASSAKRSFSGVVRAPERVDLAFRVGGPLVEMPVKRGQLLEQGELIAQIDPRDFEVNLKSIEARLDEANAQLTAMRVGARAEVIARLENQVTAAKAEFRNAEIELNRSQDLLDKEVISQSEFDTAKLRYDTSREQLLAAEQRLAEGRAGARKEDIDAQEATIRGLEAQKADAENALRDTSLRAPFKGRIARQYVENFQKVPAGEPIVSLQSQGTIEVVTDVPESVIAILRRSIVEKITAEFEAVPDRVFQVAFKEIETEADRRTQTFAVTVEMEAPEDVNLLPGMPATVQLHLKLTEKGKYGFPVPASAVWGANDGTPKVWTVNEDRTVNAVEVVTGDMGEGWILIMDGLKDGDTIITAGVHSVRPGMKVFPFVLPDEKKN